MIHLAILSIMLTLITGFATLSIAFIIYSKERNALFGHYLFDYFLVMIFVIMVPVAFYLNYFKIFPQSVFWFRLAGNLIVCLFTSRCIWVEYPAKVSLRYRILDLVFKVLALIFGAAFLISFFYFREYFILVRNINGVIFLLGFFINFWMIRLEKNPVDYQGQFDWNRLTKTINMITMIVILPVVVRWLNYIDTPVSFLFRSWFPIIPAAYFITQLIFLIFLARSIIKPKFEMKSAPVDPASAEQLGLSKREVEIAVKLIDGLSYKNIGNCLFISLETVKFHTKNIYRKAGVKKRQDLIRVLQNLPPSSK